MDAFSSTILIIRYSKSSKCGFASFIWESSISGCQELSQWGFFILDVHPSFFPKVYDMNYFRSIDKYSTVIQLPNWTCNDSSITSIDFSLFTSLQSLEIGDDCYCSVETFRLDGFKQLKSLKIGTSSFTKLKKHIKESLDSKEVRMTCSESKSFHILNCESLESIQIGEFSFSDYAGEFELKNLPQLQSIQIGAIESESCNFHYCSFTIRGK